MNDVHPSIATIQQRVAEHFKVRVIDIRSARRGRPTTRARHAAMYLCRELTQFSLPVIAHHFGKRDHTAVMYAIKRVEARMAESGAVAEEVGRLRKSIAQVNGKAPLPRVGNEDMLDRLHELLSTRHAAKRHLAGIEREIEAVLREAGWEKQAVEGGPDAATGEVSRSAFTGLGAAGVVNGHG